MATVSSDREPQHQNGAPHAASLPRQTRVSMLVPLRRLARASTPGLRATIAPAALKRASIAWIMLVVLLAAAITHFGAATDDRHALRWPTDTIEAWLRNMTVTPFAPWTRDDPYVSPEGLALPLLTQQPPALVPDRGPREE